MAKRGGGRGRTAKQKAALRKAQLVSARKRKGKGKPRGGVVAQKRAQRQALKAAGGVALAYAVVGAGLTAHQAVKHKKLKDKYNKQKRESDFRDFQNRKRVAYRENVARVTSQTRGLPTGASRAGRTNSRYSGIYVDV